MKTQLFTLLKTSNHVSILNYLHLRNTIILVIKSRVCTKKIIILQTISPRAALHVHLILNNIHHRKNNLPSHHWSLIIIWHPSSTITNFLTTQQHFQFPVSTSCMTIPHSLLCFSNTHSALSQIFVTLKTPNHICIPSHPITTETCHNLRQMSFPYLVNTLNVKNKKKNSFFSFFLFFLPSTKHTTTVYSSTVIHFLGNWIYLHCVVHLVCANDMFFKTSCLSYHIFVSKLIFSTLCFL